MKNLSDVNGGSLGNVCVETRFRSQFRLSLIHIYLNLVNVITKIGELMAEKDFPLKDKMCIRDRAWTVQ